MHFQYFQQHNYVYNRLSQWTSLSAKLAIYSDNKLLPSVFEAF